MSSPTSAYSPCNRSGYCESPEVQQGGGSPHRQSQEPSPTRLHCEGQTSPASSALSRGAEVRPPIPERRLERAREHQLTQALQAPREASTGSFQPGAASPRSGGVGLGPRVDSLRAPSLRAPLRKLRIRSMGALVGSLIASGGLTRNRHMTTTAKLFAHFLPTACIVRPPSGFRYI